jgi:hypothetical protein
MECSEPLAARPLTRVQLCITAMAGGRHALRQPITEEDRSALALLRLLVQLTAATDSCWCSPQWTGRWCGAVLQAGCCTALRCLCPCLYVQKNMLVHCARLCAGPEHPGSVQCVVWRRRGVPCCWPWVRHGVPQRWLRAMLTVCTAAAQCLEDLTRNVWLECMCGVWGAWLLLCTWCRAVLRSGCG